MPRCDDMDTHIDDTFSCGKMEIFNDAIMQISRAPTMLCCVKSEKKGSQNFQFQNSAEREN